MREERRTVGEEQPAGERSPHAGAAAAVAIPLLPRAERRLSERPAPLALLAGPARQTAPVGTAHPLAI